MANNPKNAYLARLEQEKQDRARIAQYVNERQSLDALIVAINEEFGFGAERINRLISRYIETRIEVADMFMDDRYKNKDKELAYAKAKLHKRLQSIMGSDYPEHDVRYTVNTGKQILRIHTGSASQPLQATKEKKALRNTGRALNAIQRTSLPA